MSRISGIGGGLAGFRRAVRAGGGFAMPAAAAQADAAAPSRVAGLFGLLAVQEDDRRRSAGPAGAARLGGLALDELRGLQLDLLRGGHDPRRLARLAALADEAGASAAAELRPLLDQIALRLRIELARHAAAARHGAAAMAPPEGFASSS